LHADQPDGNGPLNVTPEREALIERLAAESRAKQQDRFEELPVDIHVYRVRQSTTHPARSVRKAWYGRTWQAEWEPCPWCPRAYTRRGVLRKARRWSSRNLEWQLTNARRRQRARAHLTARRDPFYADQRKTGEGKL
jgi:hypothetical protein